MLRNLGVVILLMAGILFVRLKTTTETAPPDKQNLVASVLEKIKEQHCHAVTYEFSTGTADNGRAGLGCTLAAGHATTIQIQWFKSAEETQIEFNSRRESEHIQYVHGYPAAYWVRDAQNPPGATFREMIWYADNWLFFISSFDDTGYLIALDPAYVSEVLYQLAVDSQLIYQLPLN